MVDDNNYILARRPEEGAKISEIGLNESLLMSVSWAGWFEG